VAKTLDAFEAQGHTSAHHIPGMDGLEPTRQITGRDWGGSILAAFYHFIAALSSSVSSSQRLAAASALCSD
jgi:hypothetical protein